MRGGHRKSPEGKSPFLPTCPFSALFLFCLPAAGGHLQVGGHRGGLPPLLHVRGRPPDRHDGPLLQRHVRLRGRRGARGRPGQRRRRARLRALLLRRGAPPPFKLPLNPRIPPTTTIPFSSVWNSRAPVSRPRAWRRLPIWWATSGASARRLLAPSQPTRRARAESSARSWTTRLHAVGALASFYSSFWGALGWQGMSLLFSSTLASTPTHHTHVRAPPSTLHAS